MAKRICPRTVFTFIVMSLLCWTAAQGLCSEKEVSGEKSSSIKISGSGNSTDDPVVVKGAADGQEGVRAEYTFLAKRFPKCSQVSQRLIRHKGHPIDVIRIRLANGTERDVFFDISDFFGKSAPAPKPTECSIVEDTLIFKDKSFPRYLEDDKAGKDLSPEFVKLAKEGKLKTIPKGTKVVPLRTEKVRAAEVVEIRIPNTANASGTWWTLKASLNCGH